MSTEIESVKQWRNNETSHEVTENSYSSQLDKKPWEITLTQPPEWQWKGEMTEAQGMHNSYPQLQYEMLY